MARFHIATLISALQVLGLVSMLIYFAPLLGLIVVGIQKLAENSVTSQSNMTVAYEVMDKPSVSAHSEQRAMPR